LAILLAPASGRAGDGSCEEQFDSTFALLEKAIFENKGCTSSSCHDGAASGGLDLRPGQAYDNLIDQPVASVAGGDRLRRLIPSNKDDSLLWINLAAATLPDQWQAPLRAMPLGGLPPLSLDEIEAVRLWIENGAPRAGTVPGTDELLDACLPPPKPLQVEPLAPPAAGSGIQFRAPTQFFTPFSERETCFITYYDVTEQVPAEFRGPSGDTFRYKRIENRQDPLSHHAVVVPYEGTRSVDDPVWGEWRCGGGANHGEICEPTDLDSCGEDGLCASAATPSVGCIGFAGGDASIGLANESLFNTMAPGLSGSTEGVYAEAPLRGILIWNSHGFNVTDETGKLDIWINLEFAAADEQQYEIVRFTEPFIGFGLLSVPPFGMQEVCGRWTFAPNTHLVEISSHNHKRGLRFRIFDNRWACRGGPNDGADCSPFGPDPEFPTGDLCAGATCAALRAPELGDCDNDLAVEVADLLTGIRISLGLTPLSACASFDLNEDAQVSVFEIVRAVRAALDPPMGDADEDLIYTSLTYADPVVERFTPPRFMGGPATTAAQRTITYCGLYDNGFLDPNEVKRQSTSPEAVRGFPGGPCTTPEACTAGRAGEACSGSGKATRDASCDSTPGSGDGECDACTVRFGTTTDDEMFIVSGAIYVTE
jgi:hypothetical protein